MKKSLLLTLALLFTVSLGFAAEKKAAPKKRPPNPAMAPIEDVPGLPRVLLIGDSISIGYTLPVRELLKGKANVHRIPVNGGHTATGLENIDKWLGTAKWDVIHFNWGLHDLKYLAPDNKTLADPKAPTSRQQVPPAEYEKNLTALVAKLKATGAKLIWRNTTPVPEGSQGRLPADAPKYNEIAARVMKAAGVMTEDLFSYSQQAPAGYQLPANVHYSPEGSKHLAEHVAKTIEAQLPKK